MNCVLGHDSALLRLYWAGDNLGEWDNSGTNMTACKSIMKIVDRNKTPGKTEKYQYIQTIVMASQCNWYTLPRPTGRDIEKVSWQEVHCSKTQKTTIQIKWNDWCLRPRFCTVKVGPGITWANEMTFCFETCVWCRINHLTCWPAAQCTTTELQMPSPDCYIY